MIKRIEKLMENLKSGYNWNLYESKTWSTSYDISSKYITIYKKGEDCDWDCEEEADFQVCSDCEYIKIRVADHYNNLSGDCDYNIVVESWIENKENYEAGNELLKDYETYREVEIKKLENDLIYELEETLIKNNFLK